MGAVATLAGGTSTPASPKSAPAAAATTAASISATFSFGYFSHNNLFP
jgi:hypothetical protein